MLTTKPSFIAVILTVTLCKSIKDLWTFLNVKIVGKCPINCPVVDLFSGVIILLLLYLGNT